MVKRALKWADARKGRKFINEAVAELVKLYPDMPRAEARVAAAAHLLGMETEELIRARNMLAAVKRLERPHYRYTAKKAKKATKRKRPPSPHPSRSKKKKPHSRERQKTR